MFSILRRLLGGSDDATVAHDAAGLSALLDSGDRPLVIDVREPAEYRSGHIPGAMNIPLGRVAGGTPDLKRDGRKVVVVCWSAMRSRRAVAVLRAAGLSDVSFLRGGTAAWMQQGYPVE